MIVTDEHVVLAKQLLSMLSWTAILKIFILILCVGMMIFGWYFRHELFSDKISNRLAVNPTMMISETLKNEIDSIVRKTPLIVGIKIVNVNFQRNIITDSYASYNNPTVQDVYSAFTKNKLYEAQLFDDNKLHNKRLLRLISGEFICMPFKDTTAYKYTPTLDGIITDSCSSAIPPYQGDFSGFLVIYVTSHPTKDETDRLFLLSRDLSIKIYEESKHATNNKE